MRAKLSIIIFVLILLVSAFTPLMSASSTSKTGDLLILNGPWHVGDNIDFSILVQNDGSESVDVYLQLEINEKIRNSTVFQIEPNDIEELVMSFNSLDTGKFLVNWSVIELSENHTKSFSGVEEIIVYEKQSLTTEINSIEFNSDSGYSIDIGVNLSDGNSRLVNSEIYFVNGDELILASNINLNLNPGITTFNSILGFAPSGTSKIKIIIVPLEWSSATIAMDIQNIQSEYSDFRLTIESDPNPLNPTLGESVEISIKLTNNGVLELKSGKIMAIDGQKRVLGEFTSPVLASEKEIVMKIKIDEWMSTSTTTLEFIWTIDDLFVKDTLEVVSSNSNEIGYEPSFSVDWFSILVGTGLASAIILSVRIISVKKEVETKETRKFSQKNRKIEDKSTTEKRTIECKECNKRLQVPIDYSGQVKCPSCLITFNAKIDSESKIKNNDEDLFSRSNNDVIECPKCDQVLRVPYDKRPAKARCPACKCIFNALPE
tara:strand:+ start:5681 stop:7147 length:1467 start_codon:yes stop_codon:yes gene_type:complete